MKKNSIFMQEKPLLGFVTWKANKYLLKYSHFNNPQDFNNNNLFIEGKLPDQAYEIVFNSKATSEELSMCDFLKCLETAGRQLIVHKRNLGVFKQHCPDSDYLIMRVIIQHSGKENKVHVCHDFVLVWIQSHIDSASEKSLFRRSILPHGEEFITVSKLVLKKNCMGQHRLALNSPGGDYELIHPDLAYQLRKCKNIKFYTDKQFFMEQYPNATWDDD